MKRILSLVATVLMVSASGWSSSTTSCSCCGRILSQGANGIGSASGGDLSGGSENSAGGDTGNGTNMSSADSNTRADNAVKNGLMYNSSRGWCARGANNILSYYTTGRGASSAGANAKDMGPILQSRYKMTSVQDTGSYQNGDTRVLKNNGNGHMETYMNGKWYSDFAQKGSLKNSGNYSSSTLYRLPEKTQ